RSLLPVRRGGRSEVRPRPDARLPLDARRARRGRSPILKAGPRRRRMVSAQMTTTALRSVARGLWPVACVRRSLFVVCVVLVAFLSAACRQDMHDQPKYKPLRESVLFRDGRSARPLVEGTVARGFLREDSEYYTGKVGQPTQGGQAAAPGTQPMGETGAATDTQRVAAGLNPSGQAAQAGAQQAGASSAPGEFTGYTTTF